MAMLQSMYDKSRVSSCLIPVRDFINWRPFYMRHAYPASPPFVFDWTCCFRVSRRCMRGVYLGVERHIGVVYHHGGVSLWPEFGPHFFSAVTWTSCTFWTVSVLAGWVTVAFTVFFCWMSSVDEPLYGY
jgi:hypothetical protein